MKKFLRVAAVAAMMAGGGVVAVQATGGALAAPTAYMQMNSPGDGLSPNAARQGNGRPRRMRGMRHRGHHGHHRRHR